MCLLLKDLLLMQWNQNDVVYSVKRHLVYSQLVYYPFCLLAQRMFSGLGLWLELGIGVRVSVLVS